MRKPSAELENKPKKKKAYASPTLVDYGNITKITAAAKITAGPDAAGSTLKGGST